MLIKAFIRASSVLLRHVEGGSGAPLCLKGHNSLTHKST